MDWRLSTLLLGTVVLAQTGWLQATQVVVPAHATPTAPDAVASVDAARLDAGVRCKVFPHLLDTTIVTDTTDATTEVGQWLESESSKGWMLHSMDFEVGQKPTGFMHGWLMACVTPRS